MLCHKPRPCSYRPRTDASPTFPPSMTFRLSASLPLACFGSPGDKALWLAERYLSELWAIVSTIASPRSNGSGRNSMPSPGFSGAVTKPSFGTGTFLMK